VVLNPVVVVDPPMAVPATVGVVTGVLGTLLALRWRRSRR
jgi:membrane protein